MTTNPEPSRIGAPVFEMPSMISVDMGKSGVTVVGGAISGEMAVTDPKRVFEDGKPAAESAIALRASAAPNSFALDGVTYPCATPPRADVIVTPGSAGFLPASYLITSGSRRPNPAAASAVTSNRVGSRFLPK